MIIPFPAHDPSTHELNVAPPPIANERVHDRRAVEALIDDAFGPGRLVKAAERLREGRRPYLDLSFTAWDDMVLAGCVRQWPVVVGGQPVIFLGPIVVEPVWRRHGLGAALVERARAAAWAAGYDVILLVGDASYFAPLGFQVVPPGRIVMPGPVDPRRVLAQGRTPGAAHALAGAVRPA